MKVANAYNEYSYSTDSYLFVCLILEEPICVVDSRQCVRRAAVDTTLETGAVACGAVAEIRHERIACEAVAAGEHCAFAVRHEFGIAIAAPRLFDRRVETCARAHNSKNCE